MKMNATEKCLAANQYAKINEHEKQYLRRKKLERNGIKPMDCKLPSVVQLAQLSASLARGSQDTPKRLAELALDIWEACAERLELQQDGNKFYAEQEQSRRKAIITLREPKKYPVTLDAAMLIALPKRFIGRTADRADIFKSWLRYEMGRVKWLATNQRGDQSDHSPSPDEVNERFARLRAEPIDSIRYRELFTNLIRWRKESIPESRRVAGSLGGQATASKKKSLQRH